MKVLFLNPPDKYTLPEFPDEMGNSFIETDDFGHFPPLGMLYVLSYMEKHAPEYELFFKDCVAEKVSHEDLAAYIEEVQPDYVGITSFTIALVDVTKAAETVRKVCPDAKLVLGGHHPIAFPHEAAQLPQFDACIVGEGEVAFTELIKAWDQGKDINEIEGVYTREKIKNYENSTEVDTRFLKSVSVPPAYIDDLSSVPIPNRKWIRHINYGSVVGKSSNMATILSTRGCPYLCTFCDVPYKKYRTRSIEEVVDEIEECMAMGYDEFHFYDDLFNITSRKVIQFCDEVERRNLKFTWDFRGRANVVSKESLIRAKRAGCRLISFGVETGTNEGLAELKKGVKVEKILQVFKWCREVGIISLADYIIGFPFERTVADINKNIDFLVEMDPDYAQVGILMLLPNTPLYNQGIAKGLIKQGAWEEFSLNPTTDFQISHWTEHHDLSTLVALQTAAYRRFYFRPKYIWRSLLKTTSWYEFKTKAKGAIKLFFSKVEAKIKSKDDGLIGDNSFRV
ncbi:MAG: hypothetical protein CME70_05220 [Halobacteriovorax sp.]|nr:hypothetical protein [Halobacteriovorax sp.]|tara:strand:- start:13512 stop:15041 length:1530 start_codon:yes stop_codon:yes gene_type:complete